MDNAQKIWDRLISAGLTPAGAAGLMGNLYAESGLEPTNLQNTCEAKLGFTDEGYTVAVDNGTYTNFEYDRAGYGLAQWTYPSRKANLHLFAKDAGKSIGDLDMQVSFLIQELQSSFKPLWDKLRTTDSAMTASSGHAEFNCARPLDVAVAQSADSVQEASDAVLLQFERPASVNDPRKLQETKDRRGVLAQEFYDKFAETGGNGLKLLKCILTENDCYKNKYTIKPKGVMVHSTGANNPYLRRYVQPVVSTPDRGSLLAQLGLNPNGNHWNQPITQVYTDGTRTVGRRDYSKTLTQVLYNVCVHAFIGKLADGSVAAVQTLPWNHRGWHAASGPKGSANDGYISFEMCEDGLTDPVYFGQVYQAAVELTAMLCREYGLDPLEDGVVICHQDGHQRGIASNHGDVYNWFPKHGKTMDDFRADVARTMNNNAEEDDDMKYYKTLADVPSWYKPAVQKAVDKGALTGNSKDGFNVSEDLCRTLTVLDRLGVLG